MIVSEVLLTRARPAYPTAQHPLLGPPAGAPGSLRIARYLYLSQ